MMGRRGVKGWDETDVREEEGDGLLGEKEDRSGMGGEGWRFATEGEGGRED